MAALTAARSTLRWGGGGPERLLEKAMAASTTIYQGSLVGTNASGLVVPFTAAAGIKVLGRAEETKTSAAGQNPKIKVSTGIFKWNNHGTNTVVAANKDTLVYGEDDNTVGNLATSRSIAGQCVEVDTDGVWVDTDPKFSV